MMRILIAVMVLQLLNGCSYAGGIDAGSIQVVKVNQHPTFNDHGRKLVTVDSHGNQLDELKIYPDTGVGCDSYLFDAFDKYMFIDCNGQWISINKETGRLKDEGWKWQEGLPSVELGVFRHARNTRNYTFLPEKEATVEDVYKYKDPQEWTMANQQQKKPLQTKRLF